MKLTTHLACVALAVIGPTLLGAACGTGAVSQSRGQGTDRQKTLRQHPSPAGIVDVAGMEREYFAETVKLTLPPGISFPMSEDPGDARQFGVGWGLVAAQRFWLYAWEREWLQQHKANARRARRALVVLAGQVPQCKYMTTYLDASGRLFYERYLSQARNGHASGFRKDFALNSPPELR